MADGDALSPERAQERYEEERRQGAALVQEGFESAWGWSGPAGRERAAPGGFPHRGGGTGSGGSVPRAWLRDWGVHEPSGHIGVRPTAVELSEDTAARARDRVGNAAEIVIGNIETGQGLEGRTFDAVVGVSVLHHVDLAACLERCVTVALREGGRFAFSEPNVANPQMWAERRFGPLRRRSHTTRHETAFRRRSLRAELEAAALEVEVCEPFDFLHPSIPAPLIGLGSRLGDLLERSPVRAIAGSLKVAGSAPVRASRDGGRTRAWR